MSKPPSRNRHDAEKPACMRSFARGSQEFELAERVAALPGRTQTVTACGAPVVTGAPARPRDRVAGPADGSASTTSGVPVDAGPAPGLEETVVVVPDNDDTASRPVPAGVPQGGVVAAPSTAAPSPGGDWRNLVRWRVRVEGGAWRAGVVSIFRPQALPPLVLDDGTVLPAPPLEPEPPLETIVAAGDRLEGGLVVEAVTRDTVTVRGAAQNSASKVLRNDPGVTDQGAASDPACAPGNSGRNDGPGNSGSGDGFDARDFHYCTLGAN